jgi:2-hydroxy-4-carboxymuconate semialdehyde hemiacetal dehydrogenase
MSHCQTAMVGHTRRFNSSHQWVHERITTGRSTLQHMVVETFFFRRTNTNALGKPRSWTDHLLWHHACHTVDLFQHQTGEVADRVWAAQGPIHPDLGIALDMSIGLRVPSGALCTLDLSFNNDGPIDLSQVPDVIETGSTDGIALQDRELVKAVFDGREPEASVASCLPALQTLDRIEQAL